MRILFLGNGWLGWKVIDFLSQANEKIVGIVLNSPKRQRFSRRIVEAAGIDPAYRYEANQLKDSHGIQAIASLKPDIAVCALFGVILPKAFLRQFPKGVINIHPSYLPFNRGAYPNVWSIIDRTTAGVSIHYIDEGIDTGDIIAQAKTKIEAHDTGVSLYKKLEVIALELFKQTWPQIKSGDFQPRKQNMGKGTFHKVADVEKIDEIDLHRMYRGQNLIDIIRARTFPPYAGAYFKHDGKKIYLRLDLIPEEEMGNVNEHDH